MAMKKILFVIDMQNDFIDGVLGTDEAKGIVDSVVDLVTSDKFDKVICTMDTHSPDKYLETQEGKNLPILHCLPDTWGHELHPKVKRAIDSYTGTVYHFTKNRFAAYHSLSRNLALDTFIYDELEFHLCGVCTGICVLANAMALKALYPEIPVYVHSNACACVTPESHETALKAMKTCQIYII